MHSQKTSGNARRPTNLSIRSGLLTEAKSLGINISRSAEIGIEHAVAARKQEQWLAENGAAIESANAYVEEHGLPLARFRQF